MQRLIRFFERGVFAPFLLSIQPVLHLFLINVAELNFSEGLRSILVSLFFGTTILGLAYLFTRDWRKASAVASLFILFFFLFGDMAGWVVETFGLGPVRTDLLILALVGAIVIFWTWLVQTRIKNIGTVNLYFNLLSVLLIINSGIRVNNYLRENGVALDQDGPAPMAVATVEGARPDIYYIILDGYGRQDILQALYEFDNSQFLQELKNRGFYVAAESSSNYAQTMLSLSSSLNMDYIQSLKADGVTIENRMDLVELVQTNRVRNTLAQHGYQLMSFRNQYKATVPSAEIYYDDTSGALMHPITAFESLVIDHTMVRVLSHVPVFNKVLIQMPYDAHRSEILSTFARVQEVPALDGNYFVYAHIIAPHPPFVFDENGAVLSPNEPFKLADGNHFVKSHSRKAYIVGYRKQLQYINTRVLETVDAILSSSDVPPMIILQGDHGPGAHMHYGALEKTLVPERFGILNAYYFPNQEYRKLYPSISPVNSFRVLLNQYFDTDYTLLPDRHYYSPWGYPFDFVEVTDLFLP